MVCKKMTYFNVSIFCDLQGHYDDLSLIYNLLFAILFLFTGVIIIICSGYVLIIGLLVSKKLQKKHNSFVLSLVTSDFLFGTIFVPLFVIEFLSRVLNYHGDYCKYRSWRVVFFTYLYSCRLLSIMFVSVYTYIRTCKSMTRTEEIFSVMVRYITVIVIWFLPAVVLLSVGFAEPENYKTVGTVTYVYYFVSITIIIVSYGLTYHEIKVAKKRNNSDLYKEAIDFLRGVLIWFLITTFLLATCGLILVVLTHSTKDSNSFIEHHIYLAAIFISTLDAIANPVVYLRKFKDNTEDKRNNRRTMTTGVENEKGSRDNLAYDSYSPKSQPSFKNYDSIQMSTKQEP